MDEKTKRLLKTFLKFEEEQYPPRLQEDVKNRHEKVIEMVEKFGVNRAVINTFTNMMLPLASLAIDCYDSKRWREGNLVIDLGSEPHEIWIYRVNTNPKSRELFDFEKNVFIKQEEK